MQDEPAELERIRQEYERRKSPEIAARYGRLREDVIASMQDKQRTIARWLRRSGLEPLAQRRLLDIGCGSGDDLSYFISLGFDPANVMGVELLEDRAAGARRRLPAATEVRSGNAAALNDLAGRFDIVFQSTVFTSILDDAFAQELANTMWSLVRPGGGVLWYDFIIDNPANKNVRGYSIGRVRALFPEGRLTYSRVDLAPPLNRLLTRVHPGLYGLANALPFLRTSILGWIQKPQA